MSVDFALTVYLGPVHLSVILGLVHLIMGICGGQVVFTSCSVQTTPQGLCVLLSLTSKLSSVLFSSFQTPSTFPPSSPYSCTRPLRPHWSNRSSKAATLSLEGKSFDICLTCGVDEAVHGCRLDHVFGSLFSLKYDV